MHLSYNSFGVFSTQPLTFLVYLAPNHNFCALYSTKPEPSHKIHIGIFVLGKRFLLDSLLGVFILGKKVPAGFTRERFSSFPKVRAGFTP